MLLVKAACAVRAMAFDNTPAYPASIEHSHANKKRSQINHGCGIKKCATGAMTYRLLIFDLDGTLVDSRQSIKSALRDTALEMGISEEEFLSRDLYIGIPLSDILRSLGMTDIEKARALYRSHYYHYITMEKPFPGIEDLLKKLHKRFLLALATNKAFEGTRATLQNTGLFDYFDVIESIDKGIPKPDRDTFDRISSFYKKQGTILKPEECLMVGDSPIDIEFARNAGIDSAFVRWGFHNEDQLPVKPTHIIATPEELYSVVLN